jgi:hypothetical protein
MIAVYFEFDVCKNRPTECQNIKLDDDQTLKLTDETVEKSYVNVTVIVQVKNIDCLSRKLLVGIKSLDMNIRFWCHKGSCPIYHYLCHVFLVNVLLLKIAYIYHYLWNDLWMRPFSPQSSD